MIRPCPRVRVRWPSSWARASGASTFSATERRCCSRLVSRSVSPTAAPALLTSRPTSTFVRRLCVGRHRTLPPTLPYLQVAGNAARPAQERLSLLPYPQPLADSCDETGHGATLRRFHPRPRDEPTVPGSACHVAETGRGRGATLGAVGLSQREWRGDPSRAAEPAVRVSAHSAYH